MFGPPTIEVGPLCVGKGKLVLTVGVTEPRPEGHREFRPVTGRQLKKLAKRT